MLLEVQEVGKAFGRNSVLHGVTLRVDAGETALLLGPSGSGKSTLLNIISGLQMPDTGTVTLDGETIASAQGAPNSDAVRRRAMGIIFQTLRLVSALSVRGNLALAQRLQTGGADAAAIDAMLERLGISHRADARPFELSQGEGQRAAIARALVVRPRILLADEPTSALDSKNTETVAQLMIEAAEASGTALLVATHDDRLTGHFGKTYRLEEGQIVA